LPAPFRGVRMHFTLETNRACEPGRQGLRSRTWGMR
jgi:hypothetical protein